MKNKTSIANITVGIVLAAFTLVGVIYNLTIPLFEPPDEIWHFAFADHLAGGKGLPYFSGEQKPVLLREAGQPPLYYALVALVIAPFDRSDFPGFVRFNASHPSITPGATSDRPNVFIHTPREAWPYHGAVLAAHAARAVSLLFGLLTVLGVYAVATQITPGQSSLAVAAAAIAAFTPQFVLLSNAVNNDSLMAATATWTVWLSLKYQTSNVKHKRWATAVGVLLGLGLLSKLSAVALIPFVGLAIFLPHARYSSRVALDVSRLTLDLCLTFAAAFLIAGWWYARNIVLYGDPLAWRVWLSDIGERTPTPTLWQLVPEIPALFRTYWIEFTYGQSTPWLWVILTAITLIAVMGSTLIFIRWITRVKTQNPHLPALRFTLHVLLSTFQSFDHAQDKPPISNLSLLLAWLAIIVAGVIRYMQTTPAAQGRLLFPAIAATSLLLAGGLSAWRAKWPGYAVAGLFVLTTAAPFTFVQPAFAPPLAPSLPADATPTTTRFGDALELIGYRVTATHISPGESLDVITYWRARAPMLQDHRLLIRLLRADGQSGGQAHFTLGSSLYPTTLWLPGQIIVDEHAVRADDSLPPGTRLHVQLGAGDESTPLLPVEGDAAWFSGDAAELGEIEVTTR